MGKFLKFIGVTISLAAIGYSGYTLYKKYVEKEAENEDDDFDEFFEDESFKEGTSKREYVTLDLDKNQDTVTE